MNRFSTRFAASGNRPNCGACIAAWSLLLLTGPALALDAPLSADTHISTALPTNNFGAVTTLNVGTGATALLRFDLNTLPAATAADKLVKASLKLYVNRVGTAGAIEVQTVNSAWAESTVTAGNAPTTSGAGSGPTVAVNAAGQYVTVDLTAQVKSWITNPGTNFGLALSPALSAPGDAAGHRGLLRQQGKHLHSPCRHVGPDLG